MKSIIGKGATINKPAAMTHLKPCVVEQYIRGIKKYAVTFDSPWVGFYHRDELLIDRLWE